MNMHVGLCRGLSSRRIYQLREQFESKTLDPAQLQPDELVITSEWTRCRDKGISINMRASPAITSQELLKLQSKQEASELLEHAQPIINDAANHLTLAPVLLCLADANGVILRIIGNNRVKERAELVNIVEGGVWHENAAGNNGIGTAIEKKEPVRVISLEHYCEEWHKFSCAGTPITNQQGKLLGVIDITTLREDHCSDSVCMTHLLANQIQNAYRLSEERDRFELVNHFIDYTARYPSELIIVIDRYGHTVSSNRTSREFTPIVNPGDAVNSGYQLGQVVPLYKQNGLRLIGHAMIYCQKKEAPKIVSENRLKQYGGYYTLEESNHQLFTRINKAAKTMLPVIIAGETGTGKELVAKYIHDQSHCTKGPFIAVNCGNISRDLYASLFFGYEKGAFTGADSSGKKGYFERAHGGTLFLDEITELPLDIQVALLRVLENKAFSRLGSEREMTSNFRIIGATNRDLNVQLENGSFRSDLYYRLNTFKFSMPPLRESPADLKFLVRHFTESYCAKQGWKTLAFSTEALETVTSYSWPGNVRQLKNLVESVVTLAGETITVEDLPADIKPEPSCYPDPSQTDRSSDTDEKKTIISALQKHEKICSVARELGISRSTLYRRFKHLDINPRYFKR